jgi:hypothetical protein
MKNKLNVTGTRSILTTVDEYRAAVAEIATRAHRGLAIYTPDLEPQLYDHDLFLEPMKRLVLARSHARVRVLISDPGRVVREGNRFLQMARGRPWFDDTLFVITADHGANARGTSRIPVDKYRIPVLMYAPKHVAPRRVDRLMSQIDIPPTVLGLLEFDYYTKFFGRDVLAAPPESDRAFVANYQTLGYIKGEHMALLQPRRKTEVFRVDGKGNIVAAASDAELLREAIAFYSAASHVFRSGLYRDEEQTPPEQRAALVRLRHGS